MKLFDKLNRYLVDSEYRVTIEDGRVHVINYVEIEDFSSNRVVIRHKGGKFILVGYDLVVAKMMEDEILILGKLCSIEYK